MFSRKTWVFLICLTWIFLKQLIGNQILTFASIVWLVFFFFSFYLISRKKKDRKLYPCCWSNHDEQRGGHQTSNQLEITNNHRQSSLWTMSMSHFLYWNLYLVIFEVAGFFFFFKGQLSEPQSVLLQTFSSIVFFLIEELQLLYHKPFIRTQWFLCCYCFQWAHGWFIFFLFVKSPYPFS